MKRPIVVGCCVLFIAACGPGPVPGTDAGTDAGVGAPDAGVAAPDAGEAGHDAGETRDDAGPNAADAGPMQNDSGAPDANPDGPDAGLVDLPDAHALGFDAGEVPFVEPAAVDTGLTDVSFDLEALLEQGTLEGACAAWEADPTDDDLKYRCGKWMFFFEGFGTLGVPAPLFEFFSEEFEDEIGLAQTGLGLIRNPFSETPLPLGVGQGAPTGDVEGYAYTCAACHFGQLPDGRYAVGAPNHDYDYGGQQLALFVVPSAIQPGFNPADHDAAAIERVQPMIDKLNSDNILKWKLIFDLLPLLFASSNAPEVTPQLEADYASWPRGTLDFVMAPLPLDDQRHTVSKIIPLWDIPTDQERIDFGMEHAMLAWTGGAPTLMEFLAGFVDIGGGENAAWPESRLIPLHDYIMSLRSPEALSPAPADILERGQNVFVGAGCIDCHDGPRGESTEIYEYTDIGTDNAMAYWGQGTILLDNEAAANLPWGVKAPRLFGLHGQRRYLHNGSLDSLEQLLCLEPRHDAPVPNASTGHEYGCDLPSPDREALVGYLNAL